MIGENDEKHPAAPIFKVTYENSLICRLGI